MKEEIKKLITQYRNLLRNNTSARLKLQAEDRIYSLVIRQLEELLKKFD